ncbi:hypothetical protein V8F20_008134 [Naviculisporaceae sp. PSN 640]
MSDQGSFVPPRPPTPQPQLHNRLPEELSSPNSPPKRFLVLITASQDVPGKLQIAREVSASLSAPLYQGDSLHESSAKAASVGRGQGGGDGPNEARYQRMWLSKLTRTGLLFPEESRAATGGFEGFGGSSSSTSRRGSMSSVSSETWYSGRESEGSDMSDFNDKTGSRSGSNSKHQNQVGYSHMSRPVLDIPLSDQDRLRRDNPVLMVLTHAQLEKWHKQAIRNAIKGYGIAVVFVPLDEEEEDVENQCDDHHDEHDDMQDQNMPILRPLNPKTMTSFGDIVMQPEVSRRRWEDVELQVEVDVHADVGHRKDEILQGVTRLICEWTVDIRVVD